MIIAKLKARVPNLDTSVHAEEKSCPLVGSGVQISFPALRCGPEGRSLRLPAFFLIKLISELALSLKNESTLF